MVAVGGGSGPSPLPGDDQERQDGRGDSQGEDLPGEDGGLRRGVLPVDRGEDGGGSVMTAAGIEAETVIPTRSPT
jgi:hypothetical protein